MSTPSSNRDIQLFPKEVIEFSAESFLSRVSIRSQLIYTSTLALLVAALASLPFIHVPVSVQSRGALRAEEANASIVSPVSGPISAIYVSENEEVAAGQTIALVESPHLDLQRTLLSQQLADLQDEASDLEALLSLDARWDSPDLSQHAFRTGLYRSEYFRERRAIADLKEQERFSAERFAISQSLFEKNFLSRVAFMEAEHERQSHLNKLALFAEEKRQQWEAARRSVEQRIDELSKDLKNLERERQRYTIAAPSGGIIQQIESLKVGSYLATGQTLALASPGGRLLAEIYVSTRDIGLLTPSTPVSLQIDAFNHLEWGQVVGTISDISKDIYTIEGYPLFRVLCQLDRHSLTLANGARGRLKKGMTVTARFEVARRTLFQLLRDQIDDWFSPYQAQEPSLQSESVSRP